MAHRVCVVGAGSFGSVMARIAANAVKANPQTFHQEISWWVRRSTMADEINNQRTNSQYLASAEIPDVLKASTDLKAVVQGRTVCIMALPGEFLPDVLGTLDNLLTQDAIMVSLIKSLKIESGRVLPYTELMSRALPGRSMAALMGPNIYREMAQDEFAEATIGCRDEHNWQVLKQLFETPLFHVDLNKDLVGVEMCGCLKNTVTISVGIANGLGWGSNVKAAIIRRGLLEIQAFMSQFLGVDGKIILEACGVGDVVLSAYAGRGQALASAFVKAGGKKGWSELEDEIMGGMKLPDWHNVQSVYKLISDTPGGLERYPLLAKTYRIAFEGDAPESILEPLQSAPAFAL